MATAGSPGVELHVRDDALADIAEQGVPAIGGLGSVDTTMLATNRRRRPDRLDIDGGRERHASDTLEVLGEHVGNVWQLCT